MEILKQSKILAKEFISFIDKSQSPYHVVHNSKEMLLSKGFQQIHQTSNWELQIGTFFLSGKKYFFTRNHSTLVAFNIGENFDINKTAFKIIGAHTDSPCLRLAPISKLKTNTFQQTCVTPYGGGLWGTWFDRDLMIAGRIIYNDGQKITSKLYKSSRPILKIPNLAIHLRQSAQQIVTINKQLHLRPIISDEIYSALSQEKFEQVKEKDNLEHKHYKGLLNMISKQAQIPLDKIMDIDFYLADSQPSALIGLNEQFISSPRLDNLMSSYMGRFIQQALKSLCENQNKGPHINLICLFDHQQVGSDSAQGAGSNIIPQALNRIYQVLKNKEQKPDSYFKIIQSSFIISADMAHCIHPNYQQKHQVNHKIAINQGYNYQSGVVLKINHNQRYASDGVSTSLIKALAKKANIPIQDFIVKNDSRCGSTIGPIVASNSGIKTIDLGISQLAMHSIRQHCGIIDTVYYLKLFQEFFTSFELIEHDLMNY